MLLCIRIAREVVKNVGPGPTPRGSVSLILLGDPQ